MTTDANSFDLADLLADVELSPDRAETETELVSLGTRSARGLAAGKQGSGPRHRAPLKARAERITHAMLDVVEAAFDAGETDLDDVRDLLPKVHRIVESAERLELQRNGASENLPVFNITIGSSIRIEPARAQHVEMVEGGEAVRRGTPEPSRAVPRFGGAGISVTFEGAPDRAAAAA
ncbi:MAG: hypothetical protein H0W48_03280 [Methylibium sp.]|nr:hypothetical protein [Methylibium sp.]MBA3623484.1 hypothetical protein [Methylibium sp.]